MFRAEFSSIEGTITNQELTLLRGLEYSDPYCSPVQEEDFISSQVYVGA